MRQGTTRLVGPLALLLLVGVPAASVRAQSPGPTPPPAQVAPGQVPMLPDERLGIRTVPLLLLSRPDVRADLGLDERQTADALRAIADLHARAAALRGRPDADAVAARRAVDEAQRAWLEANLSAPQRDRLVQVDLQWEGPSSLVSRPIVADTLALTPEQRAAIRKAVGEHFQARARGTGPVDEKALSLSVLGTLSPAQRDRWKAMLGRPFVPRLAARPAAATP